MRMIVYGSYAQGWAATFQTCARFALRATAETAAEAIPKAKSQHRKKKNSAPLSSEDYGADAIQVCADIYISISAR